LVQLICARSSIPYLSYTIHYIDKEWNLQSKCLSTFQRHENLKEALISALSHWGLDPEKQTCITTDSGSNIKLACQLLEWECLSCFGHNLELSVNKGLDDGEMRIDSFEEI